MTNGQREAQPQLSATQQTAKPNGREDVRMVPLEQTHSYYGQPIIKEPVWTWEVPSYFFVGGMAGASGTLAFIADLTGNHTLARNARFAALVGGIVSPALLISDLGRPKRFLNMLRVFKPTSPMSIGTWALTGFGVSSGLAVTSDALGIFPPGRRLFGGVAALLGLPVATYTAVLIADTSVPVWHEARRDLPFVFASGAGASAGAIAAVLTPVGDAGPARRLAIGGAIAEIAATMLMKRRLGTFLAEPYEKGQAKRYESLARAFTGAGAGVLAIAGRKSRAAAVAGGAMVMAGAALERWSVFKAGVQSAREPKYTVLPQREKAGVSSR